MLNFFRIGTALILITLGVPSLAWSLPHKTKSPTPKITAASSMKSATVIFDFPVTYNDRVRFWIKHFQTSGHGYFKKWLERSTKYTPIIQALLKNEGLPQDLAYVAMIESGFSPFAQSHAEAVGMWQFIEATGERYGLTVNWWLDERKDYLKSTQAAIRYKKDLYKMFGSWYLVSASYNTGENRIKRLIKKHKTNDFWKLADLGVLPKETINYVPKIIAATMIAKAPGLYGFRDLNYDLPLKYEYFSVPGSLLGRYFEILARTQSRTDQRVYSQRRLPPSHSRSEGGVSVCNSLYSNAYAGAGSALGRYLNRVR